MKALIGAVLGAVALMAAAPASADDQAFLDVMSELGISHHHGHVGDNSIESRSNLGAGYNICRNLHNGYSVLDAQRLLLANSHTKRAMGENTLSPDTVFRMVDAAQRFLCPDTL